MAKKKSTDSPSCKDIKEAISIFLERTQLRRPRSRKHRENILKIWYYLVAIRPPTDGKGKSRNLKITDIMKDCLREKNGKKYLGMFS